MKLIELIKSLFNKLFNKKQELNNDSIVYDERTIAHKELKQWFDNGEES